MLLLRDCNRFFLEVTHPPYPGHIGKCLWSPVGRNWRLMIDLRPGDCIIHYISSKAQEYGDVYRVFVGISRVAKEAVEVSREELVSKLKELNIWNASYEKFSMEWLRKYDRFYFVELKEFIEFPKKVRYEEVSKKIRVPQKYLSIISRKYAEFVLSHANLKKIITQHRVLYSSNDQIRYWLFTVSEENWIVCRDKRIYGVPSSTRLDPRKFIKQGDYLVFYVPEKGASRYGKMFVGIYKIVSNWFEGREPFWPDEKRENAIKYPLRVKIEPVKIGCISLDEIKEKLKFIREYSQIGLAFRGTPANNGKPLPPEDAKLIMNSMKPCPGEAGEPIEGEEKCVREEISYEYIRNRVLEKLFINEDIIMLVNSLLDAGENILLVGPPGTGKTMLAREITIARGYEPYYVVATAPGVAMM